MPTPAELRARALALYEQGEEHFAEANRIVHDLVFVDDMVDLDLLIAGLKHGAWDDDESHFEQAVEDAKSILEFEESFRPLALMDFILIDHLIGWSEFATALKVLNRMDVEYEQRSMWLRRVADCELRLGNKTDALRVAWQAVMHDPTDSISHRTYGTILYERGERAPAIMAHAFAIGLEPAPEMLDVMLPELIRCLNLESMSVGDGTLTIDTTTALFPGPGGGMLNPEYLFFEMSISMLKRAFGASGEATLYRRLVGHVIDSLCSFSSIALDESPEEFNAHTDPYKFYTRFYASIKRAEVVEEFTDHLYRTTHVSEASAYDYDDRFRINAYASGGDPLPENPGWRERDDADDDDDVSVNVAPKTSLEQTEETYIWIFFILLIPVALILLWLYL